jgi:hypothetical protein
VQQFDTTPADATDASQSETFSTSGVGAPARRFLPPADQQVGKLFAGFDPNPQTAMPDTAGYPVEIPGPDYDPASVAFGTLTEADKERLRVATDQVRPYAVGFDDPPRPPLMADDISRPLEVPYDSVVNADIPNDDIPQPINLTELPKLDPINPTPPKFDFAEYVKRRCQEIGAALGMGVSTIKAAKGEFAKLDIPRADIRPLPDGWESHDPNKAPEPPPAPFMLTVDLDGLSTAEVAQRVLAQLDESSLDPTTRLSVGLPAGFVRRVAETVVQATAAAPGQASPGERIKVPAPNCRQVSLELHVKVHALERPEGGDAEPFLPLYVLRGASIRVPDTSLSSLYELLNAIGSDHDSRGLRGQLAVIEDAIDDLAADGEAFLADDVVEFYEDDWTKPTDFDATLEPATPQTVGACCGNACKGEIPPIDLSTLATARDLSDGALRARDGAE